MAEPTSEVEVPEEMWREVQLWARFQRVEPEALLAKAWDQGLRQHHPTIWATRRNLDS